MVMMVVVMAATALNRLVNALAVLQLLDLIVVVIDADDVTAAASRCLLNVVDARVALRVRAHLMEVDRVGRVQVHLIFARLANEVSRVVHVGELEQGLVRKADLSTLA